MVRSPAPKKAQILPAILLAIHGRLTQTRVEVASLDDQDLARVRARGAAGGRSTRAIVAGRNAKEVGADARDEFPRCSCDCCNVAMRRPDELLAHAVDVHIKCIPSDEHGPEVCGEQCEPEDNDIVLGTSTQAAMLDSLRFCFFECTPADGVFARPQSQCVALEEDEVSHVVDAKGNAMDPALVYRRSQAAFAASAASALLSMGRGEIHVASAPPLMPAPAAALAVRPAQESTERGVAIASAEKGIVMAKEQERRARADNKNLRRIQALKAGHGVLAWRRA